jgi:DeoR/GlpR family transcriptional regulator of sugar metabolism
MFKAVERNLSLTERTEQQIEALIVDQSLRPGERLPPQDELAERLGVSRTVIREAVRFLIAKGLIEARKSSGVYVRPPGSVLQAGPPPSNQDSMTETGLAEQVKAQGVPHVQAGPAVREARLLPEERRRRILEMLDQSECVTVSDLVERLGVSRVTARADLDSLGAEGALVRSHGGALKPMDPRSDYPLQLKQTLHHAEKVRIAAEAVKLIHDGDTVAFDSGTTTCEVAKQIKRLNFR